METIPKKEAVLGHRRRAVEDRAGRASEALQSYLHYGPLGEVIRGLPEALTDFLADALHLARQQGGALDLSALEEIAVTAYKAAMDEEAFAAGTSR